MKSRYMRWLEKCMDWTSTRLGVMWMAKRDWHHDASVTLSDPMSQMSVGKQDVNSFLLSEVRKYWALNFKRFIPAAIALFFLVFPMFLYAGSGVNRDVANGIVNEIVYPTLLKEKFCADYVACVKGEFVKLSGNQKNVVLTFYGIPRDTSLILLQNMIPRVQTQPSLSFRFSFHIASTNVRQSFGRAILDKPSFTFESKGE